MLSDLKENWTPYRTKIDARVQTEAGVGVGFHDAYVTRCEENAASIPLGIHAPAPFGNNKIEVLGACSGVFYPA